MGVICSYNTSPLCSRVVNGEPLLVAHDRVSNKVKQAHSESISDTLLTL